MTNDGATEKLFDAVQSNNITDAKAAIQAGANVNAKAKYDYAPLHMAIAKDSPKLVRLLLENRADINAVTDRQETPLHWATQNAT